MLQMVYVVGEFNMNGCNRCGACCRKLTHWSEMGDERRAFCRIYDLNAEFILGLVEDGTCFFLHPLVASGGAMTMCLIHDRTDRPNFCKLFPADRTQIKEIPSCSVIL